MYYKLIIIILILTSIFIGYLFSEDNGEKLLDTAGTFEMIPQDDRTLIKGQNEKKNRPIDTSCTKALANKEQLKLKVNKALKKLSLEMLINNVPKQEVDTIIQTAGFSLDYYREFEKTHRGTGKSNLRPIEGKLHKLSLKNEMILAMALIKREYEPIATLLSNNSVSSNSLFATRSVLSAVIINDPTVAIPDLELLISSGLTPSIADFVIMIENKLTIEAIEMALSYNIDVNSLRSEWQQDHYKNNLMLLSAKQFDYSLFSLWSNLGVSATPSGNENYNVLDIIASPKSTHEIESAVQIFQQLAADGVYPYKINSLDLIKGWLPAEVKKSFQYYFNAYKETKVSAENKIILERLTSFYGKSIKARSFIDNKLDTCTFLFTKTSPQDIYNRKYMRENDIDSLNTVEILLNKYRNLSKDVVNFIDKVDSNEVNMQSELLTKHGLIENSQLSDLKLILAIKNNVTYDELLPLIIDRTEVPFDAISYLISNRNLKLLKQLVPHGLHIMGSNKNGENALQIAARLGTSNQMFEYFVTQGVNIHVEPDLITETLKQFQSNADTVYFLSILINSGLDIKKSHLNVMPLPSTAYTNKFIRVSNFIKNNSN